MRQLVDYLGVSPGTRVEMRSLHAYNLRSAFMPLPSCNDRNTSTL